MRKHANQFNLQKILDDLKRCINNKDPNPSKPSLDEIVVLMDRQLFYFDVQPAHKKAAPPIIQELGLCLDLCTAFSKMDNDYLRYRIFDVIFSMARKYNKDCRLEVLCKLVSLGISLKNTAVLEAAALWMKTTEFEYATHVANSLIDDFCLLKEDGGKELIACMKISPRFCCVFITAVAHHYSMLSKKEVADWGSGGGEKLSTDRWPSIKLLEIIQSMILDDPSVCNANVSMMDKLWRSALRAASSHQQLVTLPLTPHHHIASWCVKSPLIHHQNLSSDDVSKYVSISDKLHFAFLLSLHASTSSKTNKNAAGDSPLWSGDQLGSLVESLRCLCDDASVRIAYLHSSLDRFAQLVQIAIKMKILPITLDELRQLTASLPKSDLLRMVLNGRLDDKRQSVDMDVD